MPFQIHALPAAPFRALFDLTDVELAARCARRVVAEIAPGYPCRVSLEDARAGETLVLVNHTHLPERSPYRASHAVYVRQGARQARPEPGEVPAMLRSRLLSVRGFGGDHLMRVADVVEGEGLAAKLEQVLGDQEIDYVHLHIAKPGCFAARVTRAGQA